VPLAALGAPNADAAVVVVVAAAAAVLAVVPPAVVVAVAAGLLELLLLLLLHPASTMAAATAVTSTSLRDFLLWSTIGLPLCWPTGTGDQSVDGAKARPRDGADTSPSPYRAGTLSPA